MTVWVGSNRERHLYLGSKKIKEAYIGSDLVYVEHYPVGTVLVNQTTAMSSSSSIVVRSKQTLRIQLVGAGAGTSVQAYDL